MPPAIPPKSLSSVLREEVGTFNNRFPTTTAIPVNTGADAQSQPLDHVPPSQRVGPLGLASLQQHDT